MIERYTLPAMSGVWHDWYKYSTWIKVELAVLQALVCEKIVPQFDVPKFDELQLGTKSFVMHCKEEENVTKHDVVAFLNIFERYLKTLIGDNSRFVHYGLTSSDLVDTALALQIKSAMEIIGMELDKLISVLIIYSLQYKNTIIMGRTHGMYAEPTTFGHIMYLYTNEFGRHSGRKLDLTPRIFVGKMSGSVGTHAHLPPQVEKRILTALGLGIEEAANQIVQRDRHAELLNWIALVGCSLEKLATQIRHLSRSEVGEVAEGHSKGYKGSSSMPHKHNPINSENICGLSRLLRGYAIAGMEDVALWHERDISHSSVERVAIPDAFCVLHFMLDRMTTTLENLEVNTTLMHERVEYPNLMWISQAVMLRLIEEGMSRKEAHSLVQESLDNATSKLKNNNDLGIDRHLKHIT